MVSSASGAARSTPEIVSVTAYNEKQASYSAEVTAAMAGIAWARARHRAGQAGFGDTGLGPEQGDRLRAGPLVGRGFTGPARPRPAVRPLRRARLRRLVPSL